MLAVSGRVRRKRTLPTSTRIEEKPGCVCKLQISMYVLKHGGQIWGFILASKLQLWAFKLSIIDPRVFFKHH